MLTARERAYYLKSSQEQAMAAWINYLNQCRLDKLTEALRTQDQNLETATKTIDETLKTINKEIILRNRGGDRGMHGFIAEVSECGVGNARREILGKAPIYKWINDNGAADLQRNGAQQIQQKFVNSGNHLSLQAIRQHHEQYKAFLEGGNVYQIPKDHYDKIQYLMSISKEQANKMSTSNGDFSLKQWQEVHAFFENGDIKISDIEPSHLTYKEVQRSAINDTLKEEKTSLRKTDKTIRGLAYEASKPSLQEGAMATVASAGVEGGFTFCALVIQKVKSGKSIKDFTSDDWKDIISKSGIGFVKGGVRGSSIYALTNYTATPAAVASALVTASFGIAQQVYLFRNGQISEEELILNSEILCVDVSVSAFSSLVGQTVIPIPVLGAVIGNTVGMLIYKNVKDKLKWNERQVLERYRRGLRSLELELDRQYKAYVEKLNAELKLYYSLLEDAFAIDYREALNGSVRLALYVGVPCEKVLKNREEIDNYFSN